MSSPQLAERFSAFLIEVAGDYGPTGADWIQGFESEPALSVRIGSDRSVVLARRGDLDDARRVLESMEASMRVLSASVSPSVVHVCGRWHHGAVAFVDYASGNFEAALKGLTLADEAVIDGMEQEAFLILLTPCGYEFTLHRARIARNRGRRALMEQYLESAREMVENVKPFYRLRDGREIYCSDVYNFLSRLTLSPSQQSVLGGLVRDISLPNFERMAKGIRQAQAAPLVAQPVSG